MPFKASKKQASIVFTPNLNEFLTFNHLYFSHSYKPSHFMSIEKTEIDFPYDNFCALYHLTLAVSSPYWNSIDFIFRCYFYGHELACWNNNNSLRPGTFLLSVVAAGQAKAKHAIARCPTIKLFGYRFTFSESIKRLMAIKSFRRKLL